MTLTIDRDVAEAIYELVDYYETEQAAEVDCPCVEEGYPSCAPDLPLPNFSETLRILPKIGETKEWFNFENVLVCPTCGVPNQDECVHAPPFDELLHRFAYITLKYMESPTEEEGIKRVSAYLRKILV